MALDPRDQLRAATQAARDPHAPHDHPHPWRCHLPPGDPGHDPRPDDRRYPPRLNDDELTRAIHEARRNRDLTDHGLARLYALCPRAVEVFDSEEAPSRSIFQHTFKAFLELRGFPIPVFEADWHGYQVDAYYADHTLIIELDGYRDHSLPDRFEADRERDELAIALDHATLRITWKRLTRKPGELDRNLRAILAARAPRVSRHGDRDT